jgi:uncharacterized protein involved in tellurium resistance
MSDVKINSALNPRDGRVYFFINDKIIAYSEKDDLVVKGYPVAIETEWKGLFPSAPDAACLYPNGYIYFFKGDQYIRSTIKTKKVSAGYPKPIKGNWKDLWETGIDACVTIGDYVYFFKGNECLKYGATKAVPLHGFEGPKPIQHYFPGLWADGIDAAVSWHDETREHLKDKIYFFKGHQYMRFDIGNNCVDKGYPNTIRSGWPGLEEAIKASSLVLKEPDTVVTLPEITNLVIKLRWFKSVDLDLAAIYVLKNGNTGIVYFGSKGNMNEAPYINLNKDAMYNDKNEEIITVKDLNQVSELYLVCWDFSNRGGTGIFDDADVNVCIVDNNANSTTVHLKQETGKDAACIAHVYQENGCYRVKNLSKYFKRESSSSPGQLITKIKS